MAGSEPRNGPGAGGAKVILIGGDGGRTGVPRHVEHLLRACDGAARFIVLSERDRGGYAGLRGSMVRHIALPGLASHLRPGRMLVTARLLAHLLRREAPDLVWAHARMGVLLLHLLLLAGALRRLSPGQGAPGAPPGPALAITYHGLPFGPGQRPWLAGLSLALERLSLRHGPPRSLIFLSAAARDDFVTAVGPALCARHRLEVLANSSALGSLPEGGSPRDPSPLRRVLVVGRVAPQKNLDRALRLFAALPGSYRMTFCGEGTDSHAFRRLARRIIGDGALRRVEFIGPVADLRPWYAAADVFLLTSRYEGQPIAALEAFEAGLPLVLPDLPGCREILAHHPRGALLTGAAGCEDVTEDALRLLALAEGQARARDAQRREIYAAWARHHGFTAWSRAMADLLARLLPDPPATPPRDGQILPFRPPPARPPGVRPKSGS